MTVMLSPIPARSYTASSGNEYQADQYGVISNVTTLQDIIDLKAAIQAAGGFTDKQVDDFFTSAQAIQL